MHMHTSSHCAPTHSHHASHLAPTAALTIARGSSRAHANSLLATCSSSPSRGSHRRADSLTESLLFELELEEGLEQPPRRPPVLDLVLGEALPNNAAWQELWQHAMKAKEELLNVASSDKEQHGNLRSSNKNNSSSVDTAAFAEALAEYGYMVWLRRGTYTCPAELGLSHIRHTFVVVSLPSDPTSGSSAAASEYVVVDPNYKECFQLGGSGAGEYQALLALLPPVFVGGAEQWQKLVNLLCKEMERVFDARGVSLPPWRSPTIVLGHWLVNHADDIQVSPSGASSCFGSRMQSTDLGLAAAAAAATGEITHGMKAATMLASPLVAFSEQAATTPSPPLPADTPTVDEQQELALV